MATTVAPQFLRPKDAAVYLGLSIATVARMRADGTGPVFTQLLNASAVTYEIAALDAWLRHRPRYKSTSERTVAETVAA